MGQVNIRKRGQVYQYQFETAKVNGKRTQISKSGFKTKSEALLAGQKAQAEYMSGETISKESQMTYGNYLDFWYENYCKNNYKYSTYKRYYSTFNYLKKELGKYKIGTLTGYQLNQFLLNMYMQNHTTNSIRNFQKVIKSSLNTACYHYGYIKTDPSAGIKLPNKDLRLVFVKANGKYSGTDIIRYPFKIIHHELGIKKCRFYDLRGSYATQVLRNGAEIRDVADILGHSKVETTENYYISSTEESRKEANDILEKIIQTDVIKEIINYKF